jgi:hypothetical protein
MAKKKTKAKTPTKRKATKQVKLRTQFMSAFTAEFIGDLKTKKFKWPAIAQTRQSTLADFETFLDVLMRAGYLLQPVPPDGSNSLSDRLAQFLIAQKWPVSSPVPKKFAKKQSTVHLIEISVITDRLLEAINAQPKINEGAGGGGEGWPPH